MLSVWHHPDDKTYLALESLGVCKQRVHLSVKSINVKQLHASQVNLLEVNLVALDALTSAFLLLTVIDVKKA